MGQRLKTALLDLFWPWGRITRLRSALAQALADNEELQRRLSRSKARKKASQ